MILYRATSKFYIVIKYITWKIYVRNHNLYTQYWTCVFVTVPIGYLTV